MKKTNRRISSLLLLLLAAMALLAFGVFTNVLTDIWGHNIKVAFQNNPVLIAAFALLLGVVGYLYTKIENRSEKPAAQVVDKDQYEEAFVQFRKNLLEQYQIRLNSKTGRRLPINLTAKSTHFGMNPERVEAFFKDKELTIESENIASEIDKILKTNDRLLLIGDPGAGKTTILLYAAINILNTSYSSDDSKSSDELQKLPLILNLATWREGRDFAEWYAQSIAHSYSLSPVFVQELLRRNAVVPFFDGFDEVAEEYRNDCFQKMAAYFGDRREMQLIVSSRKNEYAAAEADAPVYAEIEVQPLSLTQIKRSLSENAQSQAADRALLHALEHDPWLAEAVETPFYLNTASFLFGKGQRTLADFPFKADSTEGRQAELLEVFVSEQVPEERDRKYLSFLAGKMEQENFLVFELLSMQPWWCGKIRSFEQVLNFGFAWGILLPIVWVGGLFLGLNGSSFSGILLAFALMPLFISSDPGSEKERISSNDIQVWCWSKCKKYWKKGLFGGLFEGLAGSLVRGLIFGLTGGLFLGLIGDLIGGLFFFLIGGLFYGLVEGLVDAGTTTNFYLHLPTPYKRFQATFWNQIRWPLMVLLAGLSGLAAAQTFSGFVWMKALKNPAFLFAILLFGVFLLLHPILSSSILEHFSLRLVLYLEGKMPLRVVTFMDRMSEQLIFEDNRRTNKKGKKMRGATWRFRHKILQDYFAKPR